MPDLIATLKSSKSNEWYTPAVYTEAARKVMGGIDLDPASCAVANETVRASTYYSLDDGDGIFGGDGLDRPWYGRVWLNPPYGRKRGTATWSRVLLERYESGDVSQACLLVGANTDTRWFRPLWDYPICFVSGRIAFLGGSGRSNTNGSAIVYLGEHKERFRHIFSEFGPVCLRWR